MRMRYALILILALSYYFGPAGTALGQQSNAGGRKVVHRVEPAYPELARKMNLSGTVKVVANIGADGTVTKVEPVGGSPLLVQAAQDAVAKWKFAAGGESKEIIELHFSQ